MKEPHLLVSAALIASIFVSHVYAKEVQGKATRVQGSTNLATITLEGDTLFAFNDDKLTQAGKAALDKLLKTNVLFVTTRYKVSGHTDRIGSDDANTKLSFRRAESVKKYLLTQNKNLRLEAAGMGPKKPLVQCSDKQERQALIKCLAPNRRVEIEQIYE